MAGSPNSEKAFVERVTLVSMAIKQELCSVLGSTGFCSQKVLMVSLRREQPAKRDEEQAAEKSLGAGKYQLKVVKGKLSLIG